MEWTDEGIVLAVKAHGESAAIAQVLTVDHGRHAGLVYGGRGRAMRPLLQPGNRVRATWRARLADHLGSMALEPVRLRAGQLMDDALALQGVLAASAVAVAALPEREPHTAVHDGLETVFAAMETVAQWPALLVRWEAGLLTDLGYGLDLRRCAVSGDADNLTHVSPRTGRAVDGDHPDVADYRDKLLRLPPFLLGRQAAVTDDDVRDGLTLTGHFLERWVLWPADRQLPDARARLMAMLAEASRGVEPVPNRGADC